MNDRKCTGYKALSIRCKYRRGRFHCARFTSKYGPYCWQHTQLEEGVSIEPSTISGAGLGLFAKKDFDRNQPIVQYSYSEPVTKKELNKTCPGDTLAVYAVERKDGKFENAYKSNDGVGRYANDVHGTRKKQNVELKDHKKRVWLVAKKKVKKGEELLTDYGPSYWK